MKLSKIERLILANQYEILAALNCNDEAMEKDYLKRKEIIENEYLFDYEEDLFGAMQDNKMSEKEYLEVRVILTMYNDIQYSYNNLSDKDKEGINEKEIIFEGFDMHSEVKYCRYAEFFLKFKAASAFLPKRSSDLNSHFPSLGKYREMYSAWKAISNRSPKNSNAEQIRSVLTAGR